MKIFLAIRDERREIDVVLDKVNDELHKEQALIEDIKSILAKVLKSKFYFQNSLS